MKSSLLFLAFNLLIIAAMAQNPFLEKQWNTPFGVPPFDKIKTAHFKPAIEEGIRQQNLEIAAIADSKQAPTFANTIEAIENSGQILYRVSTILSVFTSSNTSAELQDVDKWSSPSLSEHFDGLYMNDKIFQRVKAVYVLFPTNV